MYTSIASFLGDWKAERLGTLRVMTALTDSSLSRRVWAEGRTLGFLAWHVVLTLGEMGAKAGLAVEAPPEDSEEPTTGAAISSAYDAASRSLAEQVRTRWTDAMLADEVEMYGSAWTRAGVLVSLVKHQIHHRGQMTVLMRQADIPVPGMYGPAREEWAAMGMPPMK